MEGIKIDVSTGGYPVFVMIEQGDQMIRLRHNDFLKLEHAISEAKRQILCSLDKRDWHELDPNLAGA